MKITETSERRVASPDMSLSAMHALGYQVMDKLQERISQNKSAFNFLRTENERCSVW